MGIFPNLRKWVVIAGVGRALSSLAGEVDATDAGAALVLDGRVLRARIENDLVIRTDRHFTHGSQATYLHDEQPWPGGEAGRLGRFVQFLPKFGLKPLAYRWGVEVGQNIYTPDDIEATELVANDRPYAGFLFAAVSLDIRGQQGRVAVNDHWNLELGLTGPGTLAEDAQNTIHRVRHLALANGWRNQLQTEAGPNLQFQRTWRFRAPLGRVEVDFLPHIGGSLGYFFTDFRVGGQWRIGWNLPDDFGWATINDLTPGSGGNPRSVSGEPGSAPRRGIHALLGVEGKFVVHNLFISGSLLHDSHGLSPKRAGGDFNIGVVYTGRHWDVALVQSIRAKEYDGQPEVDSFGSLTIGRRF